MIKRLLAIVVALALLSVPAAADFTITGTVVYDSTYFGHDGKILRCLGTACAADTGTLGHTLGFLDGNKTDSGTNDYTGANTFSGVYGRYREITADATLDANDCGRTIVATSGSAINLTTFAAAAAAGKVCAIMAVQQGAGQLNVLAGGGTTLVNPIGCTRAFGQYAMVSLVVTGNLPNEWKIGGGCLP